MRTALPSSRWRLLASAPAGPADGRSPRRPAGAGHGGAPVRPPAPAPPPIDRQRGVALGHVRRGRQLLVRPPAGGDRRRRRDACRAGRPAVSDRCHDATTSALHTRFSPTLAALAEVVRAASATDFEVMLFPIIRLSSPGAGQWRGTLAPRDRDAWFSATATCWASWAAVAGVTGATRLVVGSELSSLEDDLDHWRPLVERMRAIFSGKLVYSANWDHYRSTGLFDLVDEEGISGYFNLREASAPADDAALEAGWRRARREIEAWRIGRTHPFIFTELGYRSRKGVTAAPWDEGPGGTPDLDEQRRAFAAFRRVWATAAALDGVYIWNWYGFGGLGNDQLHATGEAGGAGSTLATRRFVARARPPPRPRSRRRTRRQAGLPASRPRPGPPGPPASGLPASGAVNHLPRGACAAARSHPICRLVCAPSRVNRRRFTRAGAPVFRILMRASWDLDPQRIGFGSATGRLWLRTTSRRRDQDQDQDQDQEKRRDGGREPSAVHARRSANARVAPSRSRGQPPMARVTSASSLEKARSGARRGASRHRGGPGAGRRAGAGGEAAGARRAKASSSPYPPRSTTRCPRTPPPGPSGPLSTACRRRRRPP